MHDFCWGGVEGLISVTFDTSDDASLPADDRLLG